MTENYLEVARRAHAWIAERNGQMVGILVLKPAEHHLLLENIAVEPEAQGLGVGGRMLRFAEERALALGLPEVQLYTNEAMTENRDLYRRHGYRETHRATVDGYHRVFFSKVLNGRTTLGTDESALP